MSDSPIDVVIGFTIDEELVQEARGLSPRLRVHALSPAAVEVALGRSKDEAADREILDRLAEAEVLFAPANLEPRHLAEARNLRWWQLLSAGADRLFTNGLIDGGYTVTNLSGLHATVIGEYVLGAMLVISKGIHLAIRDQEKHAWNFRWNSELKGQTVGIVGMGAIGGETARLCKAFGMRVLGCRRSALARVRDGVADEVMPLSDLHDLLAESDYVVLSMPLTKDTTGMIGEAELAAMKPTAWLINIARGPVVDEPALIRVLKEQRIAGAFLDVFEKEPLPQDSPLWDLPNAVVTPHTSGAVQGYGHRAAEIFLDNLKRYLAGEPLRNVVERERGY
jgi:phosphoglycerate dehydrogenase-like enzyme